MFSGFLETAYFGAGSFIIAADEVIGTCTNILSGMKGKLFSNGTKITGIWIKFSTRSSPNEAGKFKITTFSNGKILNR